MSQAARPLAGRVAAVVGGGSGAGFALAEALAKAGVMVGITGATAGELMAAMQSLSMHGVGLTAFTLNPADPTAPGRFLDLVRSELGAIDLLVLPPGAPDSLAQAAVPALAVLGGPLPPGAEGLELALDADAPERLLRWLAER